MEENLTLGKALFIEQKVKEYLDYTITSLDRLQAEGTTVLQWMFAVIVGGLGLLGSVGSKSYWSIAGGFLAASVWAAWSAIYLLRGLHSRETMPPGNFCESLNTMLDEPEDRMRWREARGVDGRIRENVAAVEKLANCVDAARRRFAWLPLWFIGGIAITWIVLMLSKANPTIHQWLKPFNTGEDSVLGMDRDVVLQVWAAVAVCLA